MNTVVLRDDRAQDHARFPPQHCPCLRAERACRICRRHRIPAPRRPVRILHERQFDTPGRQPRRRTMGNRRRRLRPIVLFVIGAAGGSLLVLGRGLHRQPWLLFTEALLLAIAALAYAFRQPTVAIGAIVLAMGLENAVFQIHGGAGLGLTYVTGALVKVGQLLADALMGGPRLGFLPNLLLWAALVFGSLCGALAYHWMNLVAIWFAAAFALALGAIVAERVHR